MLRTDPPRASGLPRTARSRRPSWTSRARAEACLTPPCLTGKMGTATILPQWGVTTPGSRKHTAVVNGCAA